MFAIAVVFLARCLLIGLFFPFSAFDKVVNHQGALAQAAQVVPNRATAAALLMCGLFVEIVMSLAVLTGILDRLAAFILSGYCIVTALLWKRFWTGPDFRLVGPSAARDVFWDFMKNLAVAGGFLMLTFGATAQGVTDFIDHPFSSTHPYSIT